MLTQNSMKAAVLFDFNDVRIVDKPVPSPGPGEVLLKIKACGICGSDIKVINQGLPSQPPFGDFIIGHEYAGEVVTLGETVDEFKVGDRVAVEVHKGCGRCQNCIMGEYTTCLNYGNIEKGHRANGLTANGGFAEYAVNHVNTLYKLPKNISFEESTTITTAGTSLYGIDVSGGYIAGDTVVVLGPGPIGLMCVQIAKALGAGKVILTGTRDERLTLGKKLGADLVIDAAGGDDSLQQAFEITRKGGKVSILAYYKGNILVNFSLAVQNGINVYTVRGEGRRNVGRALSLMEQGKINGAALITHTFSLNDINKAIKTFKERIGGALKVVVKI